MSTTSGPAGSRVEVSGPLYYLNADGEVRVPANDAIQAWWGLDPSEYATASQSAVRAANGGSAEATPSGGELVGDDRPHGACSFDLGFTVPGVDPGEYPVSVLAAAGVDASTRVYGSFTFELR